METEYTADNIKVIDSFGESVRMRPRLYFDCFSENALDSLAFEIACHALDEHFDGNCTEIRITVWRDACSIWYDAGMPLSIRHEGLTHLEAIMTVIYACTNLKKHLDVGQKYCKTGMAAVNFASEKCTVKTALEGQKGTFEFELGEIKFKQIEPDTSAETWTEILVQPSPAVFGDLKFTSNGIAERALKIRDQLKDLNLVVEDQVR